jgi:hypothetical protein
MGEPVSFCLNDNVTNEPLKTIKVTAYMLIDRMRVVECAPLLSTLRFCRSWHPVRGNNAIDVIVWGVTKKKFPAPSLIKDAIDEAYIQFKQDHPDFAAPIRKDKGACLQAKGKPRRRDTSRRTGTDLRGKWK